MKINKIIFINIKKYKIILKKNLIVIYLAISNNSTIK